MFRFSAAHVAFALLCFVPALNAQPPGGSRGRFPFGGPEMMGDSFASLVAMAEVQKELGVSREQQELLEALLSDLRNQRRNLFSGMGSPPEPGNEQARMEEVRKNFRKFGEQADDLVAMILEPKQAERIRELRLQREGVRALDRPDLAKTLELTEPQMKRIREIRTAEAGPAAPPGQPRPNPQTRETQKRIETEVLSVFTEKQKEAWEKLKGKPFSFPERTSPFDRRGPGPRERGKGGAPEPR